MTSGTASTAIETATAWQKREIRIAQFLTRRDPPAFRAIDQTSVRTFFSPLADALLKKQGATLAKVAPTTALTSASGHDERRFLADRFQIETVITSHDPSRINFSDNTAIHESLLIARRPEAERLATRFISLRKMPKDAHEAILLSDRISRGEPLGEWGTEHMWPWPRVREGDWTAALYYHAELAEAMRDLAAFGGDRPGYCGKDFVISSLGGRESEKHSTVHRSSQRPGPPLFFGTIPRGFKLRCMPRLMSWRPRSLTKNDTRVTRFSRKRAGCLLPIGCGPTRCEWLLATRTTRSWDRLGSSQSNDAESSV